MTRASEAARRYLSRAAMALRGPLVALLMFLLLSAVLRGQLSAGSQEYLRLFNVLFLDLEQRAMLILGFLLLGGLMDLALAVPRERSGGKYVFAVFLLFVALLFEKEEVFRGVLAISTAGYLLMALPDRLLGPTEPAPRSGRQLIIAAVVVVVLANVAYYEAGGITDSMRPPNHCLAALAFALALYRTPARAMIFGLLILGAAVAVDLLLVYPDGQLRKEAFINLRGWWALVTIIVLQGVVIRRSEPRDAMGGVSLAYAVLSVFLLTVPISFDEQDGMSLESYYRAIRGRIKDDDLVRKAMHPATLITRAKDGNGAISVSTPQALDPNSTEMDTFRGPRPKGPKEEGVIRIFALGGSTTAGDVAEDDDILWPTVLQDILRAEVDERVEVYNAGVDAWGAYRLVKKLKHLIIKNDPDVVIFYGGFNDKFEGFGPIVTVQDEEVLYKVLTESSPDSSLDAAGPELSWLQRARFWIIERLCVSPFTQVLRDNIWLQVTWWFDHNFDHRWDPMVPAPVFESLLNEMADLGKKHGFTVILVSEASPFDLRDYEAVMARVGKRDNVIHATMLEQYYKYSSGDLTDTFLDTVHLTAKGYRGMAIELARLMRDRGLVKRRAP